MARTRGPLMSVAASGNVAGVMQFRQNRYGGHAYRPPAPRSKNQAPPSPAQAAIRVVYAEALADWRALPQAARDRWNVQAAAHPRAVSGWNLYAAHAIKARNQPRETYPVVEIDSFEDFQLTPDGRAYSGELTADGMLTIGYPDQDLKVSILYLTSDNGLWELAIAGTPEWMDGAPQPIAPGLGRRLEVYIRATPTWIGLSVREYY